MNLVAQTQTLPELVWQNATPTAAFWYLYTLVGIGCYGGYDFWGFFGRALYWLGFPIHASIFTIVRLTTRDYRWFLVPVVLLGGLIFTSLIVAGETTENKGQVALFMLVITAMATYFAAKPRSYWTQKGRWF